MNRDAPTPENEVRRRGMYCVVPVWGERYLRIYLDYVLASQLSRHNLPGLRHPEDHRYLIVTDENGCAMIEASPQYWRLRATMHTEIHVLPPTAVAHDHMSDCYRIGIGMACRDDAAVVFLFADGIFSDGTFPRLEELLNAGRDAVFCAGIRTNGDATQRALEERRMSDGSLLVSPRDVVRVGFENLHEWTCGSFWEDDDAWSGERLPLLPSNLLWRAGPNAALARCFHLHPLLVYPQIKTSDFDSTVDDYFVLAAGVEQSRIHVIRDSDELCFIDLTERMRRLDTDMGKGSIRDAARWASCFANTLHRYLATKPIRFHDRDVAEAQWRETEARSDEVMRAIAREIRRLERPWNLTLDAGYIRHYIPRLQREQKIRWDVAKARSELREAAARAERDQQSETRQIRANLRAKLKSRFYKKPPDGSVFSLRAARLGYSYLPISQRMGHNIRAWSLAAIPRAATDLRFLWAIAVGVGVRWWLTLHRIGVQLSVLPHRVTASLNESCARASFVLHRWLFGPPDQPTLFSWRRSGIDTLLGRFDQVYSRLDTGTSVPAYVVLGEGELLLARRATSRGARAYRLIDDGDKPTLQPIDHGRTARHDLVLVEGLRRFPNRHGPLPDCAEALQELATSTARLVILTHYATGARALAIGAPPLSIEDSCIGQGQGWQRIDAIAIGGGGTLAIARVFMNIAKGLKRFPNVLALQLVANVTAWGALIIVGPFLNRWIARSDRAGKHEKTSWSMIEIYEASGSPAAVYGPASD
jgi:hypothetical protein